LLKITAELAPSVTLASTLAVLEPQAN